MGRCQVRVASSGRLELSALAQQQRRASQSARTATHYEGMDVAYISAVSALAGSVIGGLTSTGTTWLTQRAQIRAGQLVHELARRQDLYRDFIVAASKAYGDALISNDPHIAELVELYSMVSRMRVLSTPRTVECANSIMLTIIDTYFSPNKSVRELREMIKVGDSIDPLKDFSESAREEVGLLDSDRRHAAPNGGARQSSQ